MQPSFFVLYNLNTTYVSPCSQSVIAHDREIWHCGPVLFANFLLSANTTSAPCYIAGTDTLSTSGEVIYMFILRG
jgi:hypothetical protein